VVLANLGSESKTCVGSRVHLVGVSISFKKNFYRLPFTPPSLVRRFGPSSGIRAGYGSSLTLTSLKSKDGVRGTGFGSSTLRWQNYQIWSKRMAAFLRGKGQILWDVTVDTVYVQPMNLFDAHNKAVDYLFRVLCQPKFDRVHNEHLVCRI
jgi:hypothetical protein